MSKIKNVGIVNPRQAGILWAKVHFNAIKTPTPFLGERTQISLRACVERGEQQMSGKEQGDPKQPSKDRSPGSLYLHCHDLPAGHVPHLLHHPVRTSSQLGDGLQVIGLHLKVLGDKNHQWPLGVSSVLCPLVWLILPPVQPLHSPGAAEDQ